MSDWLSKRVKQEFNYEQLYSEKNLFGVEVEVEGVNITPNAAVISATLPAWKIVPDGSLRGESFEAVMRKPLGLEEAKLQVEALYAATTANGATINDSMRAGLHVHLNCQSLTIKQLFTLMAAYYCLEDLIVDGLGEERAGNFFCLRLSDAEEISFAIQSALYQQNLNGIALFTNENLRYAAMNLVSLSKFGTLEFRAMRTPVIAKPVLDWLDVLANLYKSSKLYANPAELISAMSANGEKEVIKMLVPEAFAKTLFARPNFEETLYASIRNIQAWVYQTNWS